MQGSLVRGLAWRPNAYITRPYLLYIPLLLLLSLVSYIVTIYKPRFRGIYTSPLYYTKLSPLLSWEGENIHPFGGDFVYGAPSLPRLGRP
jgi:hypothetical protein